LKYRIILGVIDWTVEWYFPYKRELLESWLGWNLQFM
jgi:hypothetical protein